MQTQQNLSFWPSKAHLYRTGLSQWHYRLIEELWVVHLSSNCEPMIHIFHNQMTCNLHLLSFSIILTIFIKVICSRLEP